MGKNHMELIHLSIYLNSCLLPRVLYMTRFLMIGGILTRSRRVPARFTTVTLDLFHIKVLLQARPASQIIVFFAADKERVTNLTFLGRFCLF